MAERKLVEHREDLETEITKLRLSNSLGSPGGERNDDAYGFSRECRRSLPCWLLVDDVVRLERSTRKLKKTNAAVAKPRTTTNGGRRVQ